MIKFGQIKARNEEKGLVTVKFTRPEACGKCSACGIGSQQGEITLPSDCRIDEWVRVEYPEGRFVLATAFVYAIPLLGLLIGLFLGWWLGAGYDLWTLAGALLGLLISLSVLFLIDRCISKKPGWTPRITAVYPDKPTHEDLGCGLL